MKIIPLSTHLVSSEGIQKNNDISQWIGKSLKSSNAALNKSDQALQSLALGNTHNLHGVMLQLEEAKLSFQLIEQIRSRSLSAYHELMKEQI